MPKKILIFIILINASLCAFSQSITFKELLIINNSTNEDFILRSKHFKQVSKYSGGNTDTVKWYLKNNSTDQELITTGLGSTTPDYKFIKDISYATYNTAYILTLKNQVIADGYLFKKKRSRETYDDYSYLKGDLHVHVIIQKQKNVRSSVVIRHFY